VTSRGSHRAPLAVLVKTYPKLSETFVLGELQGLERRRFPLRIFALERPVDAESARAARGVRARADYVPRCTARNAGALALAHVACAVRAPRRYGATLARLLRGRAEGGMRDFLRAAWLATALHRERIAHLHAHFASEPAALAALAARLAGVPFSISAHAKDIYLSNPEHLRRKLAAASFTVTCTEHNRAHLAELAPDARVVRMYHGVDCERLRRTRRDGATGRPPLVLGVGRLRAKKGFATLVAACARLRDAGIALRCQIVGYGPERDALAAQIADLGLEGVVELTGKLDHDDVVRRYADADVFVLPCRVDDDGDRDGIPNVLLEAMAMELPVVSTRVSGIPELLEDGRNGLFVEPDDVAALAAAIARLLGDPTLRETLGAAARATVTSRFTERNLETLCDLLPARAPEAGDAAVTDAARPADGVVAYVLKGYPRLSETFIANEIHLLERMGVRLRLYAVKRGDDDVVQDVVSHIRAPVEYLPELTPLTGTPLLAWLRVNARRVAAAHGRVLQRRPGAYVATLARALHMAWRYREGMLTGPRKVFVKEFLQAGEIAARVLDEPDVRHLHGHFCHGATTITWLVSRMTGLPFSFTAHAKDIYLAQLNPKDLLARKLAAARFVATCTDTNARHLRERAARPERVHTIYHGLDTAYFAPPRARTSDDGRPLVVSVGRFVEKKGFAYLVEACDLLRAEGLSFRCAIVGEDGPDRARIAGMIRAARLEDTIELRGPVTQRALRELYAAAHLFVLPCQVVADGDRDGIPNVLAEAMAMGLAVVSTDLSGIPELVTDGTDGLLVPPRDARALAGAMRRLLEDAALRAALGRAARATICERFDATRTTGALRDLFARSLSAREEESWA
jgi:glycosyltransferase involved in cell wall biosynthesis